MCGIYGGRAVHQSLWPRGAEYLLAFTCLKSDCPSHAQGGGRGGEVKTKGFKWLVHKLVVFTFVAHKVKNPNWLKANQIAILQVWSRIWTLDYQKQIQLAVRARIKYGVHGLQFQGSTPLATLPSQRDLFLVMIYCTKHQPYELQEEDLNNSWSQKWHFVWVPWFQLSISQDGVTWLPASLLP